MGGETGQYQFFWLKKTTIYIYIHIYIYPNIRKCTFWHWHPAKIQISLCIHAVWSESSLGAFRIANDTKFLHADNDADNEDRSDCMDVDLNLCWANIQGPVVQNLTKLLANLMLTLVLLNLDISCLCKQCRFRSVGQLIWICTVCHYVNLHQQSDQVIWLAEN